MADTNQNFQGNQQNSTSNKPAGLSWSQPPKQTTSPLLGSGSTKFSSSTSSVTVKNASAAKPVATNGTKRRGFPLFLMGVVVGSALTWGYYSLNTQEEVVQQTTPTPTTEQNVGSTGGTSQTTGASVTGTTGTVAIPTVGGTGSIVLPNPQPAGLKVEITSAPVTVPTWVVVYEVINGARGNVLGAGYFLPTTKSRSINLLRATVSGKTYWVGKRIDNGDKDFSSADQAVLNAAGQPLYVEFTAR